MAQRIKLLITVKTYPLPSVKYEEVVCTAGVLEDGTFVRLYPIDYRSRSYDQWYKKYQWIEVDVEKNTKDPRPESFRPVSDIVPGYKVGPEHNWAERRKHVLGKPLMTMCVLNNADQREVSLGIVKPLSVEDFLIEETERKWTANTEYKIRQMKLFGGDKKPLERVPYKFSYRFMCEEPGCKGHTKMIEDWEVGELYRKMRDKYGNEKIACEKVKERFFNMVCDKKRDTYFYVGTVLEHATWVILGAFYFKK
jgi:hypothetical protein